MKNSRFIFLLALVCMAILSRFIPHPPNFTSIGAVALFSGVYFHKPSGLPLLIVFCSMLLTDSILGFHATIPFVYIALALSTLIGQKYQNKQSYLHLPLYSLCSSMLFFVISNFGVWMMESFYPKTLSGLGICYVAAIPFLKNQIFGDLFYTGLLFGGLALAERLLPTIRKASSA